MQAPQHDCQTSQNEQLPDLVPLDENDPGYNPDQGQPEISAHPVPNSNLRIWGTGRGMVNSFSPKNSYPCAYSNAECGYGWLFQDYMMQSQQNCTSIIKPEILWNYTILRNL